MPSGPEEQRRCRPCSYAWRNGGGATHGGTEEVPSLQPRMEERRRCRPCSHAWRNGGALSAGKVSDVRAARKRQQLNNLVAMVTELAGPGDTVEDFCSGGGHVGIILAHTLPDCQVILIENKEESLVRGKVRSAELGLTNIGFIQANLDYFTGPFHIGVALHACGVVTDMVVEQCIQAGATFVVSPCCYGFVQNTLRFTFPRSKRFLETLSYKVGSIHFK
ncbi:glutathione S-transferase C-terminal domain-containing protein-like [Salmo salar]|uniref:Glutathione S-transferase C-terminal domain-containing protein-like n=1 Tax=Salmo salar TaxID=8030 RepID=A0ABM3ER87_SALSA|nr:glutathione S-transferase C-terminal domain-containing protein-like [Salmo salar]